MPGGGNNNPGGKNQYSGRGRGVMPSGGTSSGGASSATSKPLHTVKALDSTTDGLKPLGVPKGKGSYATITRTSTYGKTALPDRTGLAAYVNGLG